MNPVGISREELAGWLEEDGYPGAAEGVRMEKPVEELRYILESPPHYDDEQGESLHILIASIINGATPLLDDGRHR